MTRNDVLNVLRTHKTTLAKRFGIIEIALYGSFARDQANEISIAAGKKPESEAKETDRFHTLDGAMSCLVEDFNLTGDMFHQDSQIRMTL